MSSLGSTLRFAARSLGRAPAFSFAVVATLVLVIGPGVALLSLVEQIFWRQLPLPDAERLVVFSPPWGPFSGSSSQSSEFSVSLTYPEYRDFASWEGGPFEGVVARAQVSLAVGLGDRTEEITGEIVSGNYFDTLGVTPAAGRLLTAEDDRVPRDHPVVVLSWGAWQRRFGGDPDVVGRKLTVNGVPMTILGVAARSYTSLELGFAPEIWLPMAMKAVATPLSDNLENRRSRWLNVVARLAPGVTREQAEGALQPVYRSSGEATLATHSPSEEFREKFLAREMELLPGGRGRSDLRGRFGDTLVLLSGLVALLFGLACANLANLFIARSTRHERELTVRLAIGAGRRHLVAHLLVEAALLALTAGILGTALALSLPSLPQETLPDVLAGIAPGASPLLLALAVGLSIVAALGCGLLPALAATRGELGERLRRSGAGSIGGRHGTRQRRLLVAVQIALSAAILIGASLLARSLNGLLERDSGYRIDNVLSFAIDPHLGGASVEQTQALVEQVEREIALLPGVAAVGRSELPLLEDWAYMNSVDFPGRARGDDDSWTARFDTVSPGYLEALEIELLAGRRFDERDRSSGAPVALVSESFVREYFPDRPAVGERFTFGESAPHEIVGVIADRLTGNLRESARPYVLLAWDQANEGDTAFFFVRTHGDPSTLFENVRRVVAEIDRGLPVVDLRTLALAKRRSLAIEMQSAAIASALGLLAALLAAIGIYGVLAYAVDSHRRELALRTALGARPASLLRWLVGHAALPVVAGLIVGLAFALAAGRWIGSLLYGIAPTDAATFTAVAVSLLAVAALATTVPARRALGTDPAAALREE